MDDAKLDALNDAVGGGGSPVVESPAAPPVASRIAWEDPGADAKFTDVISDLDGKPDAVGGDTPPDETTVPPEDAAKKAPLTREEQSFKDKAYYLESENKTLKSYLETLVGKINLPGSAPAAPPPPEADPIEAQLKPFEAELKQMVENGDLTNAQAKVLYQNKYEYISDLETVKKQLGEVTGSVSTIHGKSKAEILATEMKASGIEANSEVEREALSLLKEDWGIDFSQPETLVKRNPETLKKIAENVAAVAERRVILKSAGGRPREEPPKLIQPGGKVPLPPKEPDKPFKGKTIAEIAAEARKMLR